MLAAAAPLVAGDGVGLGVEKASIRVAESVAVTPSTHERVSPSEFPRKYGTILTFCSVSLPQAWGAPVVASGGGTHIRGQ
jgi:hypothetical protein